jgi:hypothetical protein
MRATVKHRGQLLDVLRRSLSNASEPTLKTRLIDAIATLAKDMPDDGQQTRGEETLRINNHGGSHRTTSSG